MFVLTAARFWPQRWLAVRTTPQDLIGRWNQRKLRALIPRVVVFTNDPPSAERRIDFAVIFIVFWSYSRKICLNMCHGNSENLDGFSYLLRIYFIYRTNVSVSRSWIPLRVVDREQGVFWLTNKRVQNTEFSRWRRFVILYFQSYGSALFTVSKCNSCSISSFSIFSLPAGHTWQLNTEEKSWRGLKTNTKGSAYFQEKGWQLWKMWVF